jgi:hypothetical protein
MPDRDIEFDYVYESREGPQEVDPLNESADANVEVEGRGSSETLVEAGRRGRTANDDPMRRVDVSVRLFAATETESEDLHEETERKPGATRDWEIWVGGETGAEAGAKAGGIMVQLRNPKTGTGTYLGWTSGAGASLGVNVAKTSPPDWEAFKTPKPMTFQDFSGATFTITSVGFGVGAFGAEWSKFRFQSFVGGQGTPDGIQVGGISFGGVEVNLGSIVYGTMFLTGRPSETYVQVTRSTQLRSNRSDSEEASDHRMSFVTGSSEVTPIEKAQLDQYLLGVISRAF